MKLMPFLVVPAVLTASALSTDYSRERALRVESTTEIKIATSAFEVTRDGQPVETPFGGDGPSSEEVRKRVHVDTVIEHSDGAPTRVHRTFEKLEGRVSTEMGENSREVDEDCPLAGTTLELVRKDGEVRVKVIEGDAPGEDKLLEGQDLALALDALLPHDDAKSARSWKLGNEEIRQALGLEVEPLLFRTPKEDDEPAADGERRKLSMRRGAALGPLLRKGEWSGKATLAADEEHDGMTCTVIDVEIHGEGDMPEPRMQDRKGGRSPAAEPVERAAGANKFEVSLEGHLYFSPELRRPVAFEVEGKIETETSLERSRGEQSFVIHIQRAGTYSHKVSIREEAKK